MPRSRWGVAWRSLVALVVVVGCAAGATATAGLLQVKDVIQAIDTQKAIRTRQLTLPAPGAPQTLLLVGVDHRYGQGSGPGNTDTMMLVRIDDSSATINTLSIPRDLAVDVPGYGVQKINAAYSEGGPGLLIRTIRADVFPGLKVNHLLLVDFSSFANLINAIGCVYVQADHRYYNRNVGTIASDYSGIDIQPGYQKLCGGSGGNLGGPNTALAFVRFRHNDSDFVREARQQDFLRWAKQNFSANQLLSNRTTLLNDFGRDVQTDHLLHTTDGLIELFNLAINADGSAVKSIPFPYAGTVNIGGADDVTFSETVSAQAYQRFLTPSSARPAAAATTPAPPVPAVGKHLRHRRGPLVYTPPATMRADPGDGLSQAGQLGHPGLPVYYPAYIPGDFRYCFTLLGNCNIYPEPTSAYVNSYPRRYAIEGFDGRRYPSYAMTLVFASGGVTDTGTGEYFTVQGTTWPDAGASTGPPILRNPSSVTTVNGRVLDEYSQAGHLTVVAWKTAQAVYWISNTLQNNIPNDQMIAMAATFKRASG